MLIIFRIEFDSILNKVVRKLIVLEILNRFEVINQIFNKGLLFNFRFIFLLFLLFEILLLLFID